MALGALLSVATELAAVQEPRLELSPGSAENGWRATVRPIALLSDSSLVRALRAGLPLRFNFELELWRDRFLADALEGQATWSLILYQEPLSGQYNLSRSWDPDAAEWFDRVEDAAAALQRWYQGPLQPPNSSDDRFYYDARLEVEILSLGDLAELEHWLRGEAGREGDVGGALTRGIRRLFIRLIGLSARRFSARTALFQVR